MKKIIITTLAAIAIALAACTTAAPEAGEPGFYADGTATAVINATLAATRANQPGTSLVKTQFNPGDEISIVYYNGNVPKRITATYDGTDWNTDRDFYINTSGNQDIPAYYYVDPTFDAQTGITTYYDELNAHGIIGAPANAGEPYTVSLPFGHMHSLLTVNLVYTDDTAINNDAPVYIYALQQGASDELKLATDANRQCIVPNSSYILRATTTGADGREINATAPGDGIFVAASEARTLNITLGQRTATLNIEQNEIPAWGENIDGNVTQP